MFRFLLRPRWIGLTLFAVVVVGVCVRLGLWQLDRLDGRRDFNDRYLPGSRGLRARSRTCSAKVARSPTDRRSRSVVTTLSTR